MNRRWTSWTGICTLAVGSVTAVAPANADARLTLLDDDAATISRAISARPGGGAGLRLDDGLTQLPSTPWVLPRSRRSARIVVGAPSAAATPSGSSLLGLGATGMASLLRESVQAAGAHRVFVDDLGALFRGREGDDLAGALAILAKERTSYAPDGVSRRVHLYVPDPGRLLSDPGWTGARLAAIRSGGVWLKTFSGESTWTAAQWLTWPSETAAQFIAAGSRRSRVHVVFNGSAQQPAAWALARTGSACRILAHGPGGYHLGSDVDSFVTEYRRTLPFESGVKNPIVGCASAPALTVEAARGLDAAAELEASGLEIPSGGLVTPPLPAGQTAQLTVQLGADPIGLAAALGISSEEFWTAAEARLAVRGPGVALDVPVEGDGVARLDFTPPSPGPVTMRVVVDRELMPRALGAEPEIVMPLRSVGANPSLIQRVVANPSGWQLDIPLVQPGDPPGASVLEITPPVS